MAAAGNLLRGDDVLFHSRDSRFLRLGIQPFTDGDFDILDCFFPTDQGGCPDYDEFQRTLEEASA